MIAVSSDTTRTMPSRSHLTHWKIPGCIARAFVVANLLSRAMETSFPHENIPSIYFSFNSLYSLPLPTNNFLLIHCDSRLVVKWVSGAASHMTEYRALIGAQYPVCRGQHLNTQLTRPFPLCGSGHLPSVCKYNTLRNCKWSECSVSVDPCKLTSACEGQDDHGVCVQPRTYWKQITCGRNWCSYGRSLCWKWNQEVYILIALTVDNIFILRGDRCYTKLCIINSMAASAIFKPCISQCTGFNWGLWMNNLLGSCTYTCMNWNKILNSKAWNLNSCLVTNTCGLVTGYM